MWSIILWFTIVFHHIQIIYNYHTNRVSNIIWIKGLFYVLIQNNHHNTDFLFFLLMHQNTYRIMVSLVHLGKYVVSYFLLILLFQLTIFSLTLINHIKLVNIHIIKLEVKVQAIITLVIINFLKVKELKLS